MLSRAILVFLADRYFPVLGDWVEVPLIAGALDRDLADTVTCCEALSSAALIELAAPDADNESHAAIITTQGLLAIGRPP